MDWIDKPASNGSTESLVRQACYPSDLDMLPDSATDAQILDAMAQAIIGRIRSYKTASGARKYLLTRFDLLRLIADAEPEIFDSILLEYAEHQTAHP